MNSYEEKQEAKRERLREAAEKRRKASENLYSAGKNALEAIPFGQPILIGHHSERADRSYRSRAVGKIDRSVQLSNEADELDRRAENLGSAGISSDDPDAVSKLQAKLDGLIEAHASMVAANKEARANREPAPFAAYQLTNSNGRIRSVKERIESLSKLALTSENPPVIGKGWSIAEDKEDNRIVIKFDERQPEEIVKLLRSRAFLWSPSRKSWVRKITGNAVFASRQIAEILSNTKNQ